MENKLKCQVVMLPSDKGRIALNTNHDFYYFSELFITDNNEFWIPQVLYFISDLPITVGDYFLTDDRDNIHENNGNPVWVLKQCNEIVNEWIFAKGESGIGYNPDWSKKVVASDDVRLKLPLINHMFITKYTDSCSNDDIIKEVLVETNNVSIKEGFYHDEPVVVFLNGSKYKTFNQNGRVEMYPLMMELGKQLRVDDDNSLYHIEDYTKQSYTREEFKTAMREAYAAGHLEKGVVGRNFENWFNSKF